MAVILIVDDLASNRRALAALLGDRGHHLLEAANGPGQVPDRAMLGWLIRENVTVVLAPAANLSLVTIDGGQLEQIVINLVVNGRDAMPDGGTLTIETADVELDQHYAQSHPGVVPGPHVCLTVTDTGIGMSEVKAHIFEPFFTTKTRGSGTGLGLASVQGTIARSGGSIAVYARPARARPSRSTSRAPPRRRRPHQLRRWSSPGLAAPRPCWSSRTSRTFAL